MIAAQGGMGLWQPGRQCFSSIFGPLIKLFIATLDIWWHFPDIDLPAKGLSQFFSYKHLFFCHWYQFFLSTSIMSENHLDDNPNLKVIKIIVIITCFLLLIALGELPDLSYIASSLWVTSSRQKLALLDVVHAFFCLHHDDHHWCGRFSLVLCIMDRQETNRFCHRINCSALLAISFLLLA